MVWDTDGCGVGRSSACDARICGGVIVGSGGTDGAPVGDGNDANAKRDFGFSLARTEVNFDSSSLTC